MAAQDQSGNDPVIIKKYANRRLYNTRSSSYITLEDLSRMTREGQDFQVIDAKTGNDITHSVLTQIIMEEEASGGEQMLPISFLRQLISMYGDSMQSLMPHYLEATMENFRTNQRKLQDAWSTNVGTDALAKMAETNMAMFQAATRAFIPGANTRPAAAPAADSKPPANGDLNDLRSQIEAMQKKLDELGK